MDASEQKLPADEGRLERRVMAPEPERTEFDYLLNRFERASQADKPAEHGYAGHRRALFDYVRKLEAQAADAERWAAECNRRDDHISAWLAACDFIDAHVGDPDITQRMRDTYAEFQKWREHLKRHNARLT